MNRFLEGQQRKPGLGALIQMATVALTLLDAARLEEMWASCQALPVTSIEERELHNAKQEMAVLDRILETTRANVEVMRRLRETRTGALEYSEQLARGYEVENYYGNH